MNYKERYEQCIKGTDRAEAEKKLEEAQHTIQTKLGLK